MKKIRTRFAPSPTGYMHVGNLRTALYAFLAARSTGGEFVLRIEDTDQERQVEGAVEIIYDTLKENGLFWDEGPDVGGPYAPYVQSERMDTYMVHAMRLVEEGKAYYCFCDKDTLEKSREAQKAQNLPPKYDRTCANLSPDEIRAKLDAGIPFVIRQKIPDTGTTTFYDEVFGSISVENASLDDQVLIKADKMPTYNFANVIDDYSMAMNCVIRGSEYLSSAPKYNLLYEALGWEIPMYIHCPPVMRDSSNKLSKRHGDASYQDLIAKGYLSKAILNYILLLGWSPKGEKEIFSLEEMIAEFSPAAISKSPSIFDMQKLRYINSVYIAAMSEEEFTEVARPWIKKGVNRDIDIAYTASVLKKRCEVLEDIPALLDFIDEMPEFDSELYVNKKMKTDRETSREMLQKIIPVLESLEDFSEASLHTALFALIEQLGCKNGTLLWPLRVAVSGKQFTPGGGIELSAILGKEESLARVRSSLEKLCAEL